LPVFARLVGPLIAAGLVLVCAGCTTFNTEQDDVVTFVFAQPTTECEVFLSNRSIGRVSIASAAIGVPKGTEPLRLSCGAAAYAPISAEVSLVRTRDESYGVLGVNVPTPRALGARVVEPITNITSPPKTGYPPRITIDIAQRAVIVPDGWQSKM
jgi:hypothetical protein